MTEWIKCSNRMPERDQVCLVYYAQEVQSAEFVNYPGWDWYLESSDRFHSRDHYEDSPIEYWMPLPAAPGQSTEEERCGLLRDAYMVGG